MRGAAPEEAGIEPRSVNNTVDTFDKISGPVKNKLDQCAEELGAATNIRSLLLAPP